VPLDGFILEIILETKDENIQKIFSLYCRFIVLKKWKTIKIFTLK